MILYFDEDRMPDERTRGYMQRAAELVLEGNGIDPANVSLSVTIVSKDEIRELNSEYRGIDRDTDVLSFPQFDGDLADFMEESEALAEQTGEAEEVAIGDVVICEEKAQEQAEEYGHSFERESVYLFVHSVLHLIGFDHLEEEERKEMRAEEERVMGLLGLPRE